MAVRLSTASRKRTGYQDAGPSRKRRRTTSQHYFLTPFAIRFCHNDIQGRFRDGNTLFDTMTALARRRIRKRHVEMIQVVQHEGSLYSLGNRRLAVFRLLAMHHPDRCRGVKVQEVAKPESWRWKFTTACEGRWVEVRGTGGLVIGESLQDTTYKHASVSGDAYEEDGYSHDEWEDWGEEPDAEEEEEEDAGEEEEEEVVAWEEKEEEHDEEEETEDAEHPQRNEVEDAGEEEEEEEVDWEANAEEHDEEEETEDAEHQQLNELQDEQDDDNEADGEVAGEQYNSWEKQMGSNYWEEQVDNHWEKHEDGLWDGLEDEDEEEENEEEQYWDADNGETLDEVWGANQY
eukprot:TRINITY_DN10167_c0_g1_i2.p1 TRINITY_DN10167_c0_g1~~TRINITY_DN10167_c0_g1_i2.p1  ORF type:complete len:346 (-),score=81.55 TRINITY_DN10167_c0_g1_i2:510-1547(-)